MRADVGRAICAALVSSALLSCRPTISIDTGISADCVRQIARQTNGAGLGGIGGQIAQPLGLVSDLSQRFYGRQVNIRSSDGVWHFFTVQSSTPDKVLLMHLISNGPPPRMLLFVMDGSGQLQAAGQTMSGRVYVDDIHNENTRRSFLEEVRLWSDAVCG